MSPAPNLVGMPKSATYEIELGGDERAELEHRWTFTRDDLERVLAKITEREPRLALAA